MGRSDYDKIEIIEKKECQRCYQHIDVRAERCPHCQSAQSSPYRISAAHLYAIAVIFVIGTFAAGTFIYLAQTQKTARIAELENTISEHMAAVELQNDQSIPKVQKTAPATNSTSLHARRFLLRAVELSGQIPINCTAEYLPACHRTLTELEQVFWELATTRDLLDELLDELTNSEQSCATLRELLIDLSPITEPLAIKMYMAIYKIWSICRANGA